MPVAATDLDEGPGRGDRPAAWPLAVRGSSRHAADQVQALAAWSGEEVAAGPLVADAIATAASALAGEGRRLVPVVGWELHLDGTGRVDFTLFTREAPGRTMRLGAAASAGVVRLATEDALEVDVTSAGVAVAGVFHRVADADLPDELSGFGTPLLVSAMTGRGGLVRMILPVRDADDLARLSQRLGSAGIPASSIEGIRAAAALVAGPDALRLGIDLDPRTGRLGSRVGLEIIADADRPDPTAGLADLGVDPAALDLLRALARTLPRWTRRSATHPVFTGIPLPDSVDTLALTHVSVSWPAPGPAIRRPADAVLKAYLLARRGVAADGLDAAAGVPPSGQDRRP